MHHSASNWLRLSDVVIEVGCTAGALDACAMQTVGHDCATLESYAELRQ